MGGSAEERTFRYVRGSGSFDLSFRVQPTLITRSRSAALYNLYGTPRSTRYSIISLRQVVEQRFRRLQIRGVEAFGEPAVDWREEITGFGAAIPVAAESGEARGSAKFPELGLLLLGDAQGFVIQFLGRPRMPLPQQQLAFVPV